MRFSSLCNLGLRRQMGVRPSSMLPGSGFLATAPTLTRSPSPWMCRCPAGRARSFSVLFSMGRLLVPPREHLFTGSGNVALQSIRSARGVQQGDPLYPVLFALAVHPAIAEARAAKGVSHGGASTSAPFSSMTASAPVLPRPSAASSPL